MSGTHFLTIAQQVALHLREEISRGRWSETLPGIPFLTAELDVCHKTVESALKQLTGEGLLKNQGAGRPRRIVRRKDDGKGRKLRVALLVWDVPDRSLNYIVDLQHRLTEAGHSVFHTPKTLMELKMDLPRVIRMVEQTQADAWVVGSGSLEVLEWFAQQEAPVYAIFGRWQNLPIAATGPSQEDATHQATKALLKLGHRRIVMLIRRQHRLPVPNILVKSFWAILKEHGIRDPGFSLPDWDETRQGLQDCLWALFQVTPPTALIVDEPLLFTAALHFLTASGLRVPREVSLICRDPDPNFAWCVPSIAHISGDYSKVVRHIVRWAENVSRGKKDVTQTIVPVEYFPGGTVGQVSRRG